MVHESGVFYPYLSLIYLSVLTLYKLIDGPNKRILYKFK
jgi:hypothetical protein